MIAYRLKELIKKYGSSSAVPKNKKKDSKEEDQTDAFDSKDRIKYISNLLDVLRTKYQNDYKPVSEIVAKEAKEIKSMKTKGFGAALKKAASLKSSAGGAETIDSGSVIVEEGGEATSTPAKVAEKKTRRKAKDV